MRTAGIVFAAWSVLLVSALVSAPGARAAPPPDTFYVSPTGVDDASRDDSPLTQAILSYKLHGWNLEPAEESVVLNDGDLDGHCKVVTSPAHSQMVIPTLHSFSDSPVVFTGGGITAQTTWNG